MNFAPVRSIGINAEEENRPNSFVARPMLDPTIMRDHGTRESILREHFRRMPNPQDAQARYEVAQVIASNTGIGQFEIYQNYDRYVRQYMGAEYTPPENAREFLDELGRDARASFAGAEKSQLGAAMMQSGVHTPEQLDQLRRLNENMPFQLTNDPAFSVRFAARGLMNFIPSVISNTQASIAATGAAALFATKAAAPLLANPLTAAPVAGAIGGFVTAAGMASVFMNYRKSAAGGAYIRQLEMYNQLHEDWEKNGLGPEPVWDHEAAKTTAEWTGVISAASTLVSTPFNPAIQALTRAATSSAIGNTIARTAAARFIGRASQGAAGAVGRGLVRYGQAAVSQGVSEVWQSGSETMGGSFRDEIMRTGKEYGLSDTYLQHFMSEMEKAVPQAIHGGLSAFASTLINPLTLFGVSAQAAQDTRQAFSMARDRAATTAARGKVEGALGEGSTSSRDAAAALRDAATEVEAQSPRVAESLRFDADMVEASGALAAQDFNVSVSEGQAKASGPAGVSAAVTFSNRQEGVAEQAVITDFTIDAMNPHHSGTALISVIQKMQETNSNIQVVTDLTPEKQAEFDDIMAMHSPAHAQLVLEKKLLQQSLATDQEQQQELQSQIESLQAEEAVDAEEIASLGAQRSVYDMGIGQKSARLAEIETTLEKIGPPDLRQYYKISKEEVQNSLDAIFTAREQAGYQGTEKQVAQALQEAMPDFTAEQVRLGVGYIRARAHARGQSFEQYVNERFAPGVFATSSQIDKQLQSERARGMYLEFNDQLKAIIMLSRDADFSTFVHELAHVFFDELDGSSRQEVIDAAEEHFAKLGVEKEKLTARDIHEFWAVNVEYGIGTGQVQVPKLQKIFKRFMEWMQGIYEAMKSSQIVLDPRVKRVMEALFTPGGIKGEAAPRMEKTSEGKFQKEYQFEGSPIADAYWINDREKKIYGIDGIHIAAMIDNPERFGLTRQDIDDMYQKHGEQVGREGAAREELILDAVNSGWIRARHYKKNDVWSFTVSSLNNTQRGLENFILDAMDIPKVNLDINSPIQVFEISTGKMHSWGFQQGGARGFLARNEQAMFQRQEEQDYMFAALSGNIAEAKAILERNLQKKWGGDFWGYAGVGEDTGYEAAQSWEDVLAMGEEQEQAVFETGRAFTARTYHGTPYGALVNDQFSPDMAMADGALGHYLSGKRSTAAFYADQAKYALVRQKGFLSIGDNDTKYRMMDLVKERAMADLGLQSVTTTQEREMILEHINSALPREFYEEVAASLGIQEYDSTEAEGNTYELYAHMDNPFVYDMDGGFYSQEEYTKILRKARDAGHDGVVFTNVSDPYEDNVFVVFKGYEGHIKSADTLVYERNGSVRELSRRFDMENANIYYQDAYHATPHIWSAEPGFPIGRPRLDMIGTGVHGQLRGWGFYSAQTEAVAKRFLRDNWQMYKLDLPDSAVEKMVEWESPIASDPRLVAAFNDIFDAMEPDMEERVLRRGFSESREEFYQQELGDAYPIMAAFGLRSAREISLALDKQGVPGLFYADPEHDVYVGKDMVPARNYVVWNQGVLDAATILERNQNTIGLLKKASRMGLKQGSVDQMLQYVDSFADWKPENYDYAPESVNNDADYEAMLGRLRDFMVEGIGGRFWYEQSTKMFVQIAKGDAKNTKKLIQLHAVYSPQNKVDTNTTMALRAWERFLKAKDEAEFRAMGRIKNDVSDENAINILYHDGDWEGRKTNSFYTNLMYDLYINHRDIWVELDLNIADIIDGKVTADLWMYRSFGYLSEIEDTIGKYEFVENVTRRMAAELNREMKAGEVPWTPHQVQAAIWVSAKIRWEDAAVAEEWGNTYAEQIRELKAVEKEIKAYNDQITELNKKAERKNISEKRAAALAEEASHIRNVLKKERIEVRKELETFLKAKRWEIAKKLDPSEVQRRSMATQNDYAAYMERTSRVLTAEMVPSPSLGLEILTAPGEVQKAFTEEAFSIIVKDGVNELAELLGLDMVSVYEGIGTYGGSATPNLLFHVTRPVNADQVADFDKQLTPMALALQYIYKQDAVPWVSPNRTGLAKDATENNRYRVGLPGKKEDAVTVRRYETLPEARAAVAKWRAANPDDKREPTLTGGDITQAIELEYDRSLGVDDMRELSQALTEAFKTDVGLTRYSENTVLVVNYRDGDGISIFGLDDIEFTRVVTKALGLKNGKDTTGRGIKRAFTIKARSQYGHDQDWGSPEAKERMGSTLRAAGSPDLFKWADSRASEFEAILEEYSGERLQQKIAETAAADRYRTDFSRRLAQPARHRVATNSVDQLLANMYYEVHSQDAREAIDEGRYVPYSVLGEHASEPWAQAEIERRKEEAHIISGGTNDEAAVLAEVATAAADLNSFISAVDLEYDGKAQVVDQMQHPLYDSYHLIRRMDRKAGNEMFKKALRNNDFFNLLLRGLDDVSAEKAKKDRARYGRDSILMRPALLEAFAAAGEQNIAPEIMKAARKIANAHIEEFRREALSHILQRPDLRKRKLGEFVGREGSGLQAFAREELRRMAREEALTLTDSSAYDEASYDIPTIKALYGFTDVGIGLMREYGVFEMADLTEEVVENIINAEKQKLRDINDELAEAGKLAPEVIQRYKRKLTDIQRYVRELRDAPQKNTESYNVTVRLLAEAKESVKEYSEAYNAAMERAKEEGEAKAQAVLEKKEAQIRRMKEVRKLQLARQQLRKAAFSPPNKYMKSEYGQLLRAIQRLILQHEVHLKHRKFDEKVLSEGLNLLAGEGLVLPAWVGMKMHDKKMKISMEQLRELALFTNDLRQAGRRRKQAWQEMRARRQEAAKKLVMDAMLRGDPRIFATDPGRKADKQTLKRAHTSTMNAQRLWDSIDGMAGFKGDAYEFGWNMTKAAEAEALKEYYTYTDRLTKKMADLGLTPEILSEKVSQTYRVNISEYEWGDTNLQEWAAKNGIQEDLDERTESFTYNEIIGMYLALQDENTAQTVIFGNKIPLAAAQAYVDQLTDEMKQLADFMQDQFDDLWPRLQAVSVDEHDTIVAGVNRYMPIMLRGRWNGNMIEQMLVEKEQRGSVQSTRTPQGFMSSRVSIKPEHRASMRLDMVGVYMDHMRSASRYLHVESQARLLGSVMYDTGVSDVARQKGMSAEWKELQDWYEAVLTKKHREQTLWDFFRRNSTIGMLSLRPIIMVRQMASMPYYLAAGRGNLMSSAAYAMTNWADLTREVISKDPFMRDRSVDRDIERVKKVAKTDKNIADLMLAVGEGGMRGILMFDTATTMIGWHAVYTRAINMGASEQEAIAVARNVTARTQPIGGDMDVPAILRSGSSLSLLTQFSGQLNNIYGQMVHDVPSYIKSGDPMSAFLTIASMVIGQWLIWGMRNGFDFIPDEEGDIASFLRNLLISPIPIVGPLITAAFDGFSGSLPALGFIESGVSASQRIAKFWDEGGDADDIVLIGRDILRMIGPFTALPVLQMDNMLRAVTDSDDPVMRFILNFERE